jgi:hypothetical protein
VSVATGAFSLTAGAQAPEAAQTVGGSSSANDEVIRCEGLKSMDGTVLITKSFCGPDPKSPIERCEEWLTRARHDLDSRVERAPAACPQVSPSELVIEEEPATEGEDRPTRARSDPGSPVIREASLPQAPVYGTTGCWFESTVQVICRLGPNRNLRPESCLDAVGDIILSDDELHNCLEEWAKKERLAKHRDVLATGDVQSLASFSSKLKEIYSCVTGRMSQRNDCLFDLAVKFQDRRLCVLDSDPYPEFMGDDAAKNGQLRKSRPNCLARVH